MTKSFGNLPMCEYEDALEPVSREEREQMMDNFLDLVMDEQTDVLLHFAEVSKLGGLR